MSSRVSSLHRHCQGFAFGQRSDPWSVAVGFIREQPRVSCSSPRTWPNSWASESAATYGLQNGAPSSRLKIQMRACAVYPTVASALIVQATPGKCSMRTSACAAEVATNRTRPPLAFHASAARFTAQAWSGAAL